MEAIVDEWVSDSPKLDGVREFHPFRFYTAFRGLQASQLIAPDDENESIDLAILLEPIYRPDITYRRTGNLSEGEYQRLRAEYKKHLLPLLRQ